MTMCVQINQSWDFDCMKSVVGWFYVEMLIQQAELLNTSILSFVLLFSIFMLTLQIVDKIDCGFCCNRAMSYEFDMIWYVAKYINCNLGVYYTQKTLFSLNTI